MSDRLATSCSSTQLPSTPSIGVGSSIGRWVWEPERATIVRYCPASRPKRHRAADEFGVVAGQHPEVVPGLVRHPVRQGDLDMPGGPFHRLTVAGCGQFPVGAHQRRRGIVGHDHRVGLLPVDDRDAEPRPGRRRVDGAGRQVESAGQVRPQGVVPSTVGSIEVRPDSPSPRGWMRRAPSSERAVSIRIGTA